MAAMLVEERVRAELDRLRLTRMAEVLSRVSEEASRSEVSYLDFLDLLLQEESAYRFERNVSMKTKFAHLPYYKTMADFDYGFQPGVDKKQVSELLTLRFIEESERISLELGPALTTTALSQVFA